VKERVPADGHHHAEHARLRPPQTRPAKVDPGRQGVRFDSQRGHVEVGGGNAQHPEVGDAHHASVDTESVIRACSCFIGASRFLRV